MAVILTIIEKLSLDNHDNLYGLRFTILSLRFLSLTGMIYDFEFIRKVFLESDLFFPRNFKVLTVYYILNVFSFRNYGFNKYEIVSVRIASKTMIFFH